MTKEKAKRQAVSLVLGGMTAANIAMVLAFSVFVGELKQLALIIIIMSAANAIITSQARSLYE